LRQEVEALLAHEASADAFLATPAFEVEAQPIATAGDAARRAVVGTRLGQYEVVSLIGVGGMSVPTVRASRLFSRPLRFRLSTAFRHPRSRTRHLRDRDSPQPNVVTAVYQRR